MTIPFISIIAMGCSALLGVALFFGLLIGCKKRFGYLRPFWFGCGSFFLFAIVLESTVHQIVLTSSIGQTILNNLWLYGLYGGLMAGLFEETGRFLTMKLLVKRNDKNETALIYGAGHGGIEVIITLVSTMVSYIVIAVMANSGQLESMLTPMDEANQGAVMEVLTQIAQSNPAALLLGLVERISAVILHISLSVLVWKAVEGKRFLFPTAIAIHGFVDFITVILSRSGMNTLLLEAVILLMSLTVAYAAKKLYSASAK